jgi:transglutaminase-like putative cysteine protease
MKGHFYDIVEFWSGNPVKIKCYQVTLPKTKPMQYEVYNGDIQSSMVFRKDKTIYTFTRKDILPFKSESRMVAASDVAPKLLVSTSPDWFAKSTWFYKVNEDFGSFAVTPDIKAKTSEILKGAKNETDSVSRLTHWVADEIRYSGISMGCGEGYTLHKGEMTFTDRCGVCKDKAGMLITMLRAAGFKSYPAMTMAGSRIDYIPADQFNHSVTVVKLKDGKYHLLDPTWVPFVRELWSSA